MLTEQRALTLEQVTRGRRDWVACDLMLLFVDMYLSVCPDVQLGSTLQQSEDAFTPALSAVPVFKKQLSVFVFNMNAVGPLSVGLPSQQSVKLPCTCAPQADC